MKKRIITFILAVLMLASTVPVNAYAAATTTATKETQAAERTVSTLGIMRTSSLGAFVTRGQLAQMLVNASSYKGKTDWAAATSPFVDVPQSHWAASYIQLAVNNGWMYGYLGGRFKPDEAVSLQEAAYGITALLGYTQSDFQGNQLLGRMNVYYEKELNKNVSRALTETITRKDCMNLFYNMLKASNKMGVMYGTAVFGCELDPSTKEINYAALIDDKLVGPILVDKRLSKLIPFPVSDATIFIDKVKGYADDVELGDVIYYNTALKTVWAYHYSTDTGEVQSSDVYYSNGGLIPTSVIFNGETYMLDNSAVAYEFSTLSDAVASGDTITIIYESRDMADGTIVRYITGVITGV